MWYLYVHNENIHIILYGQMFLYGWMCVLLCLMLLVLSLIRVSIRRLVVEKQAWVFCKAATRMKSKSRKRLKWTIVHIACVSCPLWLFIAMIFSTGRLLSVQYFTLSRDHTYFTATFIILQFTYCINNTAHNPIQLFCKCSFVLSHLCCCIYGYTYSY